MSGGARGLGPTPARQAFTPADLWRWTLIGGYVLIVGTNLPGHLSTDSVNALMEGRSGLRFTWAPPMYSAILGAFDRIAPGTGLYVAASLLLLFASWGALARLRPAVSVFAPAVLAFWILHPEVLVYQGIVWKDVLFANLAVAAFVALALAAANWSAPGIRWAPLAAACLLLALAALVRQNGGVATLMAALALGWTARSEGWRRATVWGMAGFAAPLLLAFGLSLATPVRAAPDAPNPDVGLRLLQTYDLMAALAEDPARPMPQLATRNPAALAVLRREAPKVYSPVRSDTLGDSVPLGVAVWRFDDATVGRAWRDLVLSDPAGYLSRRASIFRWVFLTPRLELCLPIHVGVAGPRAIERELRLTEGLDAQDQALLSYAAGWLHAPLFGHLTYALLALAVAGFLLVRRQPADLVFAALMFAGLGFAASFLLISMACDYRYLYFLDLAAITGVLYVALDPRLAQPAARGRAGSAASSAARTSS